MSDESEKEIEDTFITKVGAKYPFVKAKACNDKFKITGFPTVVMIGPDGIIKHNDNPAPTEAAIEELLKGVSFGPKLPDGPQYAPLRQMWDKRDYGKLRDWLDKTLAQPTVDAALKQVCEAQKAELEKRAEAAKARVATRGAGPDFVAASDGIEKIAKAWKGFPAADAAKAELARFAADAAIKKELTAGRALKKMLASFDTSREQEVKKLVVELPKFAKKYENTYAAKQATEMADHWREKL